MRALRGVCELSRCATDGARHQGLRMGLTKATIRKRKAELLDKYREGREAGTRDGIRFVCNILFDGHSEDQVAEKRDALCDLLWFGKGWNAAQGDCDPTMPLGPLNDLVNNIAHLMRQLDKDK